MGGPGRGTHTTTPQEGPYLPGLFPKTYVVALVPGRGGAGWGIKSDQPPDSLFTPPCVGNHCDLVGE